MYEVITCANDAKNLLDQNILNILYFTASWCGPCQIISPYFEELSNKYNYNFFKIDVDEAEELCDLFKISSMPTFIFIKNDKVIHQFSGADKNQLAEVCNYEQSGQRDHSGQSGQNDQNDQIGQSGQYDHSGQRETVSIDPLDIFFNLNN